MTRGLTLKLITVGVVFWALAALFIQFVGPMGVFAPGLPMLLMFAATVVVSVLFVELWLRILRVPDEANLAAAVTLCVPGLLLDGLAITLTPGLYGGEPTVMLAGAAWLLFGVGVILAYGALRRQ